MKKILLSTAMILCVALSAQAQEITAEWVYPSDIAQDPQFEGFKIYASVDASGGPYDHFETPMLSPSGGPDYSIKLPFKFLPGTHTYYFVGVAFFGSTHSANSNEASFEHTVAIPTMTEFTVTITVE